MAFLEAIGSAASEASLGVISNLIISGAVPACPAWLPLLLHSSLGLQLWSSGPAWRGLAAACPAWAFSYDPAALPGAAQQLPALPCLPLPLHSSLGL